MRYLMLYSLMLLNLFFVAPVNASDTKLVTLSYQLDDKTFSIHGTRIQNTFVFNHQGERSVTMRTLDWPPYIGQDLCDLGWVLKFAVWLFVEQGYRVEIKFLPWVRAVREVERGEADILFPEYFIEQQAPSDNFAKLKRRQLLTLSKPFGISNIALLKLGSTPFNYTGQITQLINMPIGIVRGYQNTPEFDALMDKGMLSVVEALDDTQQLKLLLGKRVSLIIGDPAVFNYITSHHTFERNNSNVEQLEVIEPPLQSNQLYFALSVNRPNWRTLLHDVNQGVTNAINQKLVEQLSTNKAACAN